MLIPEEEAFLTWLNQQEKPVSIRAMVENAAPHYTSVRLENLKKKGLVKSTMIFDTQAQSLVGAYFITDEGRRALLEMQEMRRQEAEAKRQQALENKLSVAQIVIPVITFVLGIFVEHFSGVLSGIIDFLFRSV